MYFPYWLICTGAWRIPLGNSSLESKPGGGEEKNKSKFTDISCLKLQICSNNGKENSEKGKPLSERVGEGDCHKISQTSLWQEEDVVWNAAVTSLASSATYRTLLNGSIRKNRKLTHGASKENHLPRAMNGWAPSRTARSRTGNWNGHLLAWWIPVGSDISELMVEST